MPFISIQGRSPAPLYNFKTPKEGGSIPPGLPLEADARGERPGVVRQEAAVEAAGLVGKGHAAIDVEVPVDRVVDQEGALIEVA